MFGIPQRSGGQSYRSRAKTAVKTYDIVALTYQEDKSKEQWLKLYDNTGSTELFSYPLKHHKATVTRVATGLNARHPYIATGDSNGMVQVHNATVYQRGRFVSGRIRTLLPISSR